jgi:hypothetical protein
MDCGLPISTMGVWSFWRVNSCQVDVSARRQKPNYLEALTEECMLQPLSLSVER